MTCLVNYSKNTITNTWDVHYSEEAISSVLAEGVWSLFDPSYPSLVAVVEFVLFFFFMS